MTTPRKLTHRSSVQKDWIHVAFPVEYQVEQYENNTERHFFVYNIGGIRYTMEGATRGEAIAKVQQCFLEL